MHTSRECNLLRRIVGIANHLDSPEVPPPPPVVEFRRQITAEGKIPHRRGRVGRRVGGTACGLLSGLAVVVLILVVVYAI